MTHLDRPPIEQRRGIDCYDVNDAIVLVHSPIEQVSLAVNQIFPIEHWERDVYNCEIDIRRKGFVVFQFRGHPWTCIHEYSDLVDFKLDDLQVLSQFLQNRVILYVISDTCGSQGHYCYENGALLERLEFEVGSPLEFESQLRSLTVENMGNEEDEEDVDASIRNFIDEFWDEQPDIYIPALVQPRFRVGQQVTLQIEAYGPETFERDDFERVDYIALRETDS